MPPTLKNCEDREPETFERNDCMERNMGVINFNPSIEECLKKSPRLTRTDLQYLQQWIQKQPHLPYMYEYEIVAFLHGCNYSLERTKALIDNFFTMRTHAPEVFSDRDPAADYNRRQMQYFHVADLKTKDSQGYHIVGMGFEPVDLAKFEPNRAANMCAAMLEVVVMDDPVAEGYRFILDAKNLCLGHLTRASIHLLHVLMSFIQQASPVKLRAIHVINVHSAVERAMLLLKPLLGRDLQRLLHFHSGTMESFYEILPKDILPVEYGGTCGSTVDYSKAVVDRLLARREWVLDMERRLVDEDQRPGRAKAARDVYGIEGSFKKLDID